MKWVCYAFVCLLFHISLFEKVLSARDKIITLNDDNWRQCLRGEWMIKFYAPWCPACQSNVPHFKEFSEWSEEMNVKVAMVDITKEPGLSGRFMVTALPTFYHGKDGEFRRYSQDRSSAAMEEFIENKSWQALEPISWIRHPDSIQMTIMSGLFKTSVIMKDIHESLTETYGFSTWMSYALFGVGTLITGLTLGMILVCLIDTIYPPKPRQLSKEEQSNSSSQKSVTTTQEEDAEDKEEEATEGEQSQQEDGTDSDANNSQDEQLSQKSSRSSQEWETIQEAEVAQSEVRKRHVEKEAGDQPGEAPKAE